MASDPIAFQIAARQDAHAARTEARSETQSTGETRYPCLAKITAVAANGMYEIIPIAANGYAGGQPVPFVPVIPAGAAYAVDAIVWVTLLGESLVIMAIGGGQSCYQNATELGTIFG